MNNRPLIGVVPLMDYKLEKMCIRDRDSGALMLLPLLEEITELVRGRTPVRVVAQRGGQRLGLLDDRGALLHPSMPLIMFYRTLLGGHGNPLFSFSSLR